jgi:ABC-type sugar transport system ATPase subunit
MTAASILELRGIVKRFGDVVAVNAVDFRVEAGEVHALVGENGAGKSTLMKVLSGAFRQDAGSVLINGTAVVFGSPADAIAAGVGVIPQDLQLVGEMTVAENIVLGTEPVRGRSPFVDRKAMTQVAASALTELGETIDPGTLVQDLSIAQRQLVEIARAVSRKVRVLAFDEPTAALSDREVAALFRLIRRLTDDGVAIVYISHRLDEVLAIADRVTVMRDGAVVASAPVATMDRKAIVRAMVGRELPEGARREAKAPGDALLTLAGVSSARVTGVDLALRRGEVLGLAGLVGAGRTELARLIFGADRRTGGQMTLEGRAIDPRSPREAIELGIGLLTEDRDGLIPQLNVRENVTLAALRRFHRGPFIARRRENDAVSGLASRLRIKARSIEAVVSELSGGNRQKVVLGRWLATQSKILIFDEPTAGVDVGARQEIHALIDELAAEGRGVIVISSDLDELLAISDRVVVMREGRIAGELSAAEATRENVMTLATSDRAYPASA